MKFTEHLQRIHQAEGGHLYRRHHRLGLRPVLSSGGYCYQCEKAVTYIFEDGRCKDCTRVTPDEVRGTE